MNTQETVPSVNELLEQNQRLTRELDGLKIYFAELESTNNHLVSATWRERDMKKKLADTIAELNATKVVLDAQNKRITESINYSRKIQTAINPSESELQNIFPNSFIFYIPKDVISGDFPWLYRCGQYIYLACVDCTGHGVPGAMMSMIGNLLLNDIVNKETLLPSQVLHKLHFAVVNTLKQNSPDSNSNDGMDIALCRIDMSTGELVYAGAHRPLFVLKKNGVESISGDKFPIGGIQYKGLNTYVDTFIRIEKKDRIIMFSDGLPDQIGGPDKRKLMTKGVREFFEKRSSRPFDTLKKDLDQEFNEWRSTGKQIDDVLLMAIEF